MWAMAKKRKQKPKQDQQPTQEEAAPQSTVGGVGFGTPSKPRIKPKGPRRGTQTPRSRNGTSSRRPQEPGAAYEDKLASLALEGPAPWRPPCLWDLAIAGQLVECSRGEAQLRRAREVVAVIGSKGLILPPGGDCRESVQGHIRYLLRLGYLGVDMAEEAALGATSLNPYDADWDDYTILPAVYSRLAQVCVAKTGGKVCCRSAAARQPGCRPRSAGWTWVLGKADLPVCLQRLGQKQQNSQVLHAALALSIIPSFGLPHAPVRVLATPILQLQVG